MPVSLNGHLSKRSLFDLTQEELSGWLVAQKLPEFRAKQIWAWIYQKFVLDFHQMSDLSKSMRELLIHHFELIALDRAKVQYAQDGTVKCLLKLRDGHLIETVAMPQRYGISVCVTTQVGCNIGCTFCASGLLKKKRNLLAGEMVEQLLYIQHLLHAKDPLLKVTHVVLMGIGEPFDNYDQMVRFIRIINHPSGLSIGARHITVSTSGLASKIKAFAHEGFQVNLAVSLHAPNNRLRTALMKINKAIPIETLMEAIGYYLKQTNRRVTIEYILLRGMNDTPALASELAQLILSYCEKHLIYVNLIPYNPVHELDQYQRSETQAIHDFKSTLSMHGINVGIRKEFGRDIDAACGQLRSRQLLSK